MDNGVLKLGVLPLQLVDRITVLFLHSFKFPCERFFESLTLFLTLRGSFSAQLLLLDCLLFSLPLFSLEFPLDGPQLLLGLFLQESQAVQLPLCSVMFLKEGDIISNCLLVVLEEYLIFDLKVLGL